MKERSPDLYMGARVFGRYPPFFWVPSRPSTVISSSIARPRRISGSASAHTHLDIRRMAKSFINRDVGDTIPVRSAWSEQTRLQSSRSQRPMMRTLGLIVSRSPVGSKHSARRETASPPGVEDVLGR